MAGGDESFEKHNLQFTAHDTGYSTDKSVRTLDITQTDYLLPVKDFS